MADIARENRKTCDAIAREMGREMKDTNAASIRDGVAVIKVSGPLFRYANLMTRICGATSYELLAQDFNKAVQSPQIKGILLDIDSPGGEVNGCSELSDMIYQARGTKPIIAYASGACCSGAYWIASACDKILAADTAILGSIGVVSIFEKDDEDKTIEIVSSQSPNKRPDINTEEGKAKIQARVDELAEVFIAKVARNRGISEDDVVNNFGAGDVSVGKSAVRSGLADGLASFEEIIADLARMNFQLINKQGNVAHCPKGCEKNHPWTSEFIFADGAASPANKSLATNNFSEHPVCSSTKNSTFLEKTFMNDTININAEEIRQTERERMAKVFAADISKGKEATAQILLAKTDLEATDILEILDIIPSSAKTTDFEKAMATVKNPDISPSIEPMDETPEAVAQRIASFVRE